jgi:DNA-binding CsgD family transcriptional regulator
MLDIVGIGPEAENVYESLLTRGRATLEQVAVDTGLPVSRARIALQTLQDRRVVRRTAGSPVQYDAVDPGIALEVLLIHREEEVKLARARAIELAERFDRSAAGRDPTKLVEIITGRQAVLERIEQLQGSARHEIRCFDTPPYAATAVAANRSEQEFLERGGKARVIYDRAAIELPGRLADLEEGDGWGEQARVLPELPMKLLLVDDRVAAVPLQASPTAIESTVLVHPSGLLEGLSALFESLWQVALPLDVGGVRAGSPPGRPSREERRILSLLTAGLSDEAVARQLGVSDRTYQRRIHDLMGRLRVQTRFQLARQAIRRGWLEHYDSDTQDATGINIHHPTRIAGLVSPRGVPERGQSLPDVPTDHRTPTRQAAS